MKKINIFVTTFLCSIFISFNANAAQIVGVNFEETYQDEGISMTLQGTGLKTVVFFKAFVAGFYTDAIDQEIVLGQTAKRIEVEYFVKIPGKKLNNFTIDTMKENITNEQFNSIAAEVDLMGQYFVDLKPGDRFSLTYIPGVGTKFAHNDQLTGVIQGNDFAKALFSVWIGEKPFDQNLKNQILGLKNDQNFRQEQLAMRVER
ncbi:MAG: chalcone isomerase family protein [Candidatus Omnitrophica bacterium]|nr:chalcone isomerase family protein [Candidatus Omnitrophota bacterium]